jgi:hypothetical protein
MHNERYLSNASVYRGPCYPIFPRGVLIRLRMIETKKDAVRLVYRRMCQASSFPIPFGQLVACFFSIYFPRSWFIKRCQHSITLH